MKKSIIAAAVAASALLSQPAQAQMSSENAINYPNQASRELSDCIATSTMQNDPVESSGASLWAGGQAGRA